MKYAIVNPTERIRILVHVRRGRQPLRLLMLHTVVLQRVLRWVIIRRPFQWRLHRRQLLNEAGQPQVLHFVVNRLHRARDQRTL